MYHTKRIQLRACVQNEVWINIVILRVRGKEERSIWVYMGLYRSTWVSIAH